MVCPVLFGVANVGEQPRELPKGPWLSLNEAIREVSDCSLLYNGVKLVIESCGEDDFRKYCNEYAP